MPKTATPKTKFKAKKSTRRGTKPPAVDPVAKIVTETIELYRELLPILPKVKQLEANKRKISKEAETRQIGNEPVEMRSTDSTEAIIVKFHDRAGINKDELKPTQVAQVVRAFGDLLPLFLNLNPGTNASQVKALHEYEPTSDTRANAKEMIQGATVLKKVGNIEFPD